MNIIWIKNICLAPAINGNLKNNGVLYLILVFWTTSFIMVIANRLPCTILWNLYILQVSDQRLIDSQSTHGNFQLILVIVHIDVLIGNLLSLCNFRIHCMHTSLPCVKHMLRSCRKCVEGKVLHIEKIKDQLIRDLPIKGCRIERSKNFKEPLVEKSKSQYALDRGIWCKNYYDDHNQANKQTNMIKKYTFLHEFFHCTSLPRIRLY